MVQDYINRVNRWRWQIILVTLLLSGIAGSGIPFLQLTTDYRVFFSKEDPRLQAFEAMQAIFTKDDNVLFVIAPKDAEVFDPSTLTALEELTRKAWQIPHSIRVDSLTNFQYSHAEGDDLLVEDLVRNASALSESEVERVRRVALSEPLLVGRLISPTGHVAGVNVNIQLPDAQPQTQLRAEVPKVAAFARRLAQEIRTEYPNVDVYLTGIVMMDNALTEVPVRDMQMLMPLMFVIIFIALGVLLQSFSASITTLLVIFIAVGGAMGIAGWLGIVLSPPSAAAPIIILPLAVTDCVHIVTSFLEGMRRGQGKDDALANSLYINLQAVCITSLTTAIGFLGLNFSDAPPFQDLGNIVAIGVGIALVVALLFLPALLLVFPIHVRKRKTISSIAMVRLGNFVLRRYKALFWGILALILLLIILIPRNDLNDEFVEYFDDQVDFYQATEFTTKNLTGLYRLNYTLRTGESWGIAHPDFLASMEAFTGWYRQQPEVLHVATLSDVMTRLNMNLHGDDAAWRHLPKTQELAAQYLLLYELSLPFGLDLNDQLNVDRSAARLTVSLRPLSSKQLLNLVQRAEEWLASHVSSLETSAVGAPLMFAYISARNIRTMLWGTSFVLVAISILLVCVLRSLKMGLVSLIPNLVPAAMAFGLWGALVGQVGMTLSVVTCMTLGIVVDDTVHFLSRYLFARRKQCLEPSEAVQYAFSSVGTALWITSLVLVMGFSVLTLSSFRPNADMGSLTVITIGFALLTDFLFLPPLLLKIEGYNPASISEHPKALPKLKE